jgi:hypothetical protein
MLNRRRFVELAAVSLVFALAGDPVAAQQAKTATVTFTIEGMT